MIINWGITISWSVCLVVLSSMSRCCGCQILTVVSGEFKIHLLLHDNADKFGLRQVTCFLLFTLMTEHHTSPQRGKIRRCGVNLPCVCALTVHLLVYSTVCHWVCQYCFLGRRRWAGDEVSAWASSTKPKTKREPQSPAWGAKCSCPANEILKWVIMPP